METQQKGIVKGADNVIISGGGSVPEEDRPALPQAEVKGIFTPGTSIERSIDWVKNPEGSGNNFIGTDRRDIGKFDSLRRKSKILQRRWFRTR